MTLVALNACSSGSDTDTASADAATTVVTTPEAPTTSAAPTTAAATTTETPVTTETPLSRDALVAVSRCLDEIPTPSVFADYIRLGAFDVVETAQAACDEAKLQVGVETAPSAPSLNERVAFLNVQLGFLNLATFTAGNDVTDDLNDIEETAVDIADLIGDTRLSLPISDPPVLVP